MRKRGEVLEALECLEKLILDHESKGEMKAALSLKLMWSTLRWVVLQDTKDSPVCYAIQKVMEL